jgi:hypothetical protein
MIKTLTQRFAVNHTLFSYFALEEIRVDPATIFSVAEASEVAVIKRPAKRL